MDFNKLSDEKACALLKKEYIERCKRISEENSSDKQIVSYYENNIKEVQKCRSFNDVLSFIQEDGDFNEDLEGVFDLLRASLITSLIK